MFGCLQVISDEGKPPVKFISIDAAVNFRHAQDCNFIDGGVAHVGGNALSIFTGCARNVIEGNHLHDIGGGGVFAGIIRNRDTWQWAERPDSRYDVGYRIANNHIHDCGKDYFGAIGILLCCARDTIVAHNLIHDIPYAGIVLAGNETPVPPFGGNIVVEYNDIYDVMKVASDGAGIYSSSWFDGFGAVLRGNVIHDNVPVYVAREKGPWSAPGIYLDGGVGSCRIYTFQNNVIFRSTQSPVFLFLAGAAGNHFIDNVFLEEGNLPATFVEVLQARAGLEPAYRRSLLKTGAPECNYYPLTEENASNTAWSASQFDLPQAGRGVVEVFRRGQCKKELLRVKARGLNPLAVYDLKTVVGNFDPKREDEVLLTGVSSTGKADVLAEGKVRLTGRQLMEDGLLLRLATRPQMALVIYERVKGLAAMAEADCPRGQAPLAVVLDGARSWNPGGTYRWDLGDGETAVGTTVRHTYQAPGTYTAKLTVTDDKRAADQSAVTVIVTPADTTPPGIAAVDCDDPEHIAVTFSKPVEPASAQDAANYAMDNGVKILSASMGEDRSGVTLTTSPLSPGVIYALTVNRVKDLARKPNVIAANSRKAVRYNDLLAHWRLDDGKGDTAADSSGSGHNGTLRNGPQCVAGPEGGALSFGGKSYVELDTSLPEIAVPMSIAFWVNPAESQVDYANILGNQGTFVGLVIQQDGNKTNTFGFMYGDGTAWMGTGYFKLAAKTWQHVAVVCDGQNVVFYVNGVEKGRGQAKRPLVPNTDLHFMLGLGYAPNPANRCFNGLLRDVRIYRRALSAAETVRLAGG
jgi:PKD repeat protein